VGGHNVLEPAAIGVPVLFGQQMFNFQEIAEQILAAAAAIQCADEQALACAVLQLYRDEAFRSRLVSNGKLFVESNQGATARLAAMLGQSLQVLR